MRTDQVDTRPPSDDLDSTADDANPRRIELKVAAQSDRGLVRPNNEDRYLVVRFDRSADALATNLDETQLCLIKSQTIWALAVADGMGGHAAGEVASTMALALGLRLSQQGARWYLEVGEPEARQIVTRIESILTAVDRQIAEQAERQPDLTGMGTTLTVAALVNQRLFVYHVGDSRTYLLRNGELRRITRDQTMAQQLADAGVITPDLIGSHHTRHVLTQAIGSGHAEVEVHQLPLEDGDRLLLTTDGLTDGVSDEEIRHIVARGACEESCEQLVDRALAAGGKDNITVIVADVTLDGATSAPTSGPSSAAARPVP